MKLVKVISNLSDLKVEQKRGYHNNKREIFIGNYNIEQINSLAHNKLYSEQLEVKENSLTYNSKHISFDIEYYIPKELIPYTKCYILFSITSIEDVGEEIYKIERNKILRLTFDGPDELGLIWRLSI